MSAFQGSRDQMASFQKVAQSCFSDLLCNIPEGHPDDEQWQRTKLDTGSQAPLHPHAQHWQ